MLSHCGTSLDPKSGSWLARTDCQLKQLAQAGRRAVKVLQRWGRGEDSRCRMALEAAAPSLHVGGPDVTGRLTVESRQRHHPVSHGMTWQPFLGQHCLLHTETGLEKVTETSLASPYPVGSPLPTAHIPTRC